MTASQRTNGSKLKNIALILIFIFSTSSNAQRFEYSAQEKYRAMQIHGGFHPGQQPTSKISANFRIDGLSVLFLPKEPWTLEDMRKSLALVKRPLSEAVRDLVAKKNALTNSSTWCDDIMRFSSELGAELAFYTLEHCHDSVDGTTKERYPTSQPRTVVLTFVNDEISTTGNIEADFTVLYEPVTSQPSNKTVIPAVSARIFLNVPKSKYLLEYFMPSFNPKN